MKTRNLFAGVIACAAALSAVAVTASAEQAEEAAGCVAFTAIKSTISQGFTVEPVMVPFYEGETGIDVVSRAAEITVENSDYGSYITGFADNGDAEITLPEELTGLVELTGGRNTEGYLSSYDYTAESGWSYFLNGEYATVGIGDYVPADGDVLEFRFTIYGYGADLGIDNSSWGGASAVVEQVNAAEIIRLCASADEEVKASDSYTGAMEVLAKYGASQGELDDCAAALNDSSTPAETPEETPAETPETPAETPEETPAETPEETPAETPEETPAETPADNKNSPDTGVEGLTVIFGAAVIAAGAIALSKRK